MTLEKQKKSIFPPRLESTFPIFIWSMVYLINSDFLKQNHPFSDLLELPGFQITLE